VIVDDPPHSGGTILTAFEIAGRAGFAPGKLRALVPAHPARRDWFKSLHGEAGAGEVPVGRLDGAGLPRCPPARKLLGDVRLQRAGEQLREPLIGGRAHELSLETAQAKHLPGEIDDIARPHLLEEIRGRDRCRDARQKFPIGRPILARDQRWRAEWRASAQAGRLR
jgi:hypothetical protein